MNINTFLLILIFIYVVILPLLNLITKYILTNENEKLIKSQEDLIVANDGLIEAQKKAINIKRDIISIQTKLINTQLEYINFIDTYQSDTSECHSTEVINKYRELNKNLKECTSIYENMINE